ncbi:MAG: type I-Fv CRISPR-associated protein Cas5fv [Oleiphilus sp.]
MKLLIEFDSCWQTSFLGGDPNKRVSKKENSRPFVATTKTRGEKYQPITLDTVMGVLLRLIGEQRKLYQVRESDTYYFRDIEGVVSWSEKNEQARKINELMYLTNKSDDRCAQSSYLGVLDDDNPWFFSQNSSLLWSVLFLNIEQLVDFINSRKTNNNNLQDCSPKDLISRVNTLTNSKSQPGQVIKTRDKLINDMLAEISKKEKALAEFEEKTIKTPPKNNAQKTKKIDRYNFLVNEVEFARKELESFKGSQSIALFDTKLIGMIKFLSNKFPDEKKPGEEYCKNGIIYPSSLYSAALYLQAEHLLNAGYDMPFLKNKKNQIQIQGFSKRGFNGIRDWMNSLTGGKKSCWYSMYC